MNEEQKAAYALVGMYSLLLNQIAGKCTSSKEKAAEINRLRAEVVKKYPALPLDALETAIITAALANEMFTAPAKPN